METTTKEVDTSQQKILLRPCNRVLESKPIDCWIPPDGTVCAVLFEEVCGLCPDFYNFGIKTNFIAQQLNAVLEGDASVSERNAFLGGSPTSYEDLLLPDRQGFLYFSDAMEDLPVIFDTWTSISVTPGLRNFIKYRPIEHKGLANITGESPVKGEGLLKWIIYDDDGNSNDIIVKGYYVPGSKVQLMSVQTHLGQNKGSFHMEGNTVIFVFPTERCLTFKTYNAKH